VEADDYLFPIVRRILNSNKTNKELCSTEIQNQVMSECGYNVLKMSAPEPTYDGPMVVEMEMEERIVEARTFYNNTLQGIQNIVDENVSEMTMDARPIRA
jgi:hypothetical protein